MGRKQKIALALKNFKDILLSVIKIRKSLLGVILLAFFGVVALLGSFFVTLDPIHNGSVSSLAVDLPVAESNCVPIWLPQANLTQNVQTIKDPGFSDAASLNSWQTSTTEGVTIEHNQTFGDRTPNGCTQISFSQAGNVTISVRFEWPYEAIPRSFKGKLSFYVQGNNTVPKQDANVTIRSSIIREGPRDRSFLATMPLPTYFTEGKINRWDDMRNEIGQSPRLTEYYATVFGKEPAETIFSKAGNYSFLLSVEFNGNASEVVNPTVYLDDVDMIVYGNSYGLLGTDWLSRDLLTQLVVGTQISFIIGLVSALLSVGIGLGYGLLAAYAGGIGDEVLMRFNDMLLVIPTLPLLLVMVYVVGQSMLNIIFVVGILGWMGFARTVRSSVLSIKERPFIEAARAAGAGGSHIMVKHIIPNVMPLVYVTLAMSVPGAIVSEAALSWLGLGPTDVMSWGRMLHEFQSSGVLASAALSRWYWVIPPGVCIAALSLSFVLIGYGLDEILNPKLRARH
jgi:ABC-type dipeptide/oligopeptide/nickel transport system permease subunit